MNRGQESLMKEAVLEEGDKRYSLKWVEKVILGLFTLIGLALAARLISVLLPSIPPVV